MDVPNVLQCKETIMREQYFSPKLLNKLQQLSSSAFTLVEAPRRLWQDHRNPPLGREFRQR